MEAAGAPPRSSAQGAKAAFTSNIEFKKLAVLTVYFVLLALILYLTPLGQVSWYVILVSALVWFGLEARKNR
jgi:diacylglycerol kinase